MHPLLLCHVWALHGVQQCRGIPVEREMLFRDTKQQRSRNDKHSEDRLRILLMGVSISHEVRMWSLNLKCFLSLRSAGSWHSTMGELYYPGPLCSTQWANSVTHTTEDAIHKTISNQGFLEFSSHRNPGILFSKATSAYYWVWRIIHLYLANGLC